MPVTPIELLDLAKQLEQQPANEASLRGAISRSYYAALHAISDTFEAGVRMGGESSHHEIISRAKTYSKGVVPGRTEALEIAQWMPRLRRLRNKADYNLDETITPDDCAGILARAQTVLEYCRQIEDKRTAAAKTQQQA